MEIKVIASGSKGNSYALTSSQTRQTLLIECGTNPSTTVRQFDNIQGCLVSHEHNDHARYSKMITQKYCIPIYTSFGTSTKIEAEKRRVHILRANQRKTIGTFEVMPFMIHHDAMEPMGFYIMDNSNGERMIFATDTYYLDFVFASLHYIMIECNYDTDLLMSNVDDNVTAADQCKRLIESHMSFTNVKNFLEANDMTKVREIHLLHLSMKNADKEKFISELTERYGGLIDVYAW